MENEVTPKFEWIRIQIHGIEEEEEKKKKKKKKTLKESTFFCWMQSWMMYIWWVFLVWNHLQLTVQLLEKGKVVEWLCLLALLTGKLQARRLNLPQDSPKTSSYYSSIIKKSYEMVQYSSLLLLQCLIIWNAAYYDTRSISQLLQTSRNLYWIFR